MEQPRSDMDRMQAALEPDTSWPTEVRVSLVWQTPGGPVERSFDITADQFFGRNAYGAPLSPDHIMLQIDRMRREGPPKK